jgi:hypothetical protein
MHDKPVALLDPNGRYDGLFDWMVGPVGTGHVHPAVLARLVGVRHIKCWPPAPRPSGAHRFG